MGIGIVKYCGIPAGIETRLVTMITLGKGIVLRIVVLYRIAAKGWIGTRNVVMGAGKHDSSTNEYQV